MAVVLIDTEDLKKLISDAVAQELGKIASIRAQQPPTETYLTRAQVCEMFSINKSTLSLWQSKKKIPYLALGGKIFFRLSEIENAMKSFK